MPGGHARGVPHTPPRCAGSRQPLWDSLEVTSPVRVDQFSGGRPARRIVPFVNLKAVVKVVSCALLVMGVASCGDDEDATATAGEAAESSEARETSPSQDTSQPSETQPTETSQPPATAETMSADRVQQLVEASTLGPSDIGPEWVDASDSIQESEPSTCTPDDSGALASTPFLSFLNEGEFSEEERAAAGEDPDAMEEMVRRTKSLTLNTWVFPDTDAAHSFYESIRTVNLAQCLEEDTGEPVETEEFRPFDVPADEASVAAAHGSADDDGLTMALALTRNGPAVSFLVSVTFDGTADLERLNDSAALLNDRLSQA